MHQLNSTARHRRLPAIAVLAVMIAALGTGRAGAAHYDVYIAAGQSNMDGRVSVADLPPGLAERVAPQPQSLIYYSSPLPRTSFTTGWRDLQAGFSGAKAPPQPTPMFGPELTFAQRMASVAPQGRVAVIKIARGGTNLNEDWSPSGGYMHAGMVDAVGESLDQLTARGDTWRLRGMIWHQGESDDSNTNNRRENYAANLQAFVADVRANIADDPLLPFVVGELGQFYPGQYEQLRGVQRDVAEQMPGVGLAASVGLRSNGDFLHFDAEAVITLGDRYADQMLALLAPEPSGLTATAVAFGMLGAPWRRRAA